MADDISLHGYFRSTASYRVRIALNLKGIPYRDVSYNLRDGDHRRPDYLALNPQGLVPALGIDHALLTQSLAICEYLEETRPDPALLPQEPLMRAKVRAFAQVIACDIHPVQNLKILNRLRHMGIAEDAVTAWAAETIREGLESCARLVADRSGPYCFGDSVTLADLCLVPQLVNARRFGVDLVWPRLAEVERNCVALDAFARAAPENQSDSH